MRIVVAGALGEVGRTVAGALGSLGHEVIAASSRAGRPGVDAIGLSEAARQIESGSVDLVVNAAGRGDRRMVDRTGGQATQALAASVASTSTPAVLLSTTRVLEGYASDYAEDAAPAVRTPYAEANAEHERAWLSSAGARASVLRIANYFCAPSSPEAPQALLLPWSLVTEALFEGRIGVRSGRSTSREFVSADDVARAAVCLAQQRPASRVCATTPGWMATLEELVGSVQAAFGGLGMPVPESSFGNDEAIGPVCRPGWLREQGWASHLDADQMTDVIAGWVQAQRLD